MKIKIMNIGDILATVLSSPSLFSSSAAITFDPKTGTGFINKDDIRSIFGWDDSQVQDNVKRVTFIYVITEVYEVTDVWATEDTKNPVNFNVHYMTRTKTVGVNAVPDYFLYQIGEQKQFNGFILTGYSSLEKIEGKIPKPDNIQWIEVDGKLLPADENGAPYTEVNRKAVLSVKLVSSIDGLYVNWNGLSMLIWESHI